jgi:hypothetical protein
MKKVSILTVLFLAFAVAQAWAAPVPAGCPVGGASLAAYEALGSVGCQIGDKIFSNFTYVGTSGGTGSTIADTGIFVTTLGPTTGLDPAATFSTDIGLTFTAGWSIASGCLTAPCAAAPANFEDSKIGFIVTVVGGANMLIKDAGVAQTSAGANGTGSSASVTEGGCSAPTPCTPGTWGVLTFVTPGNFSNAANGTIFAPTGSVQVLKDIDVTAANVVGGFAAMSSVNDTFSQTSAVPEPASMMLVGCALFGAGLIRRRSKKA